MTVEESGPRRLGPADLGPALRAAFPRRRFLVVSNREPYEHVWTDEGDVEVRRPAGGLTSALDPLMRAVGGTWIAWGSGDADPEVVDERQRVRVPPEDPAYTLRRLWLTDREVHHYYFGYANQFLWPLCHLRPELTRTRARYWERYVEVNDRFAAAVADEVEDIPEEGRAAVWTQDYHLALAPLGIRARTLRATLAHFWHIPFPPLEIFRISSHGKELLEGLLANDLLGFHLPLFCDNFLRCAEAIIEAEVDWERRCVRFDDHICYVRAFPISIDTAFFREAATVDSAPARVKRIRRRYLPDGGFLGVGVDRADYSKGLEEKFAALDMLWDHNPDLRERFTYVQVAVPSRTDIEAYDWLNERIKRLVWGINDRFGTANWRPVHLITDARPAERLAVLYRAADVCIISSLQDGMNLVAKEFVASQAEDPAGVLVLSKFAGAAEELDGSVEVNPFDPEDFADRIRDALAFSPEERNRRMARLRQNMRTIYDWMAEVFLVWGAVAHGEEVPLSDADRWSRFR
ncbi:MAG: trehalose-6-phosphate synthase [Gemmatimonadota bacterium]